MLHETIMISNRSQAVCKETKEKSNASNYKYRRLEAAP